jgi:hypothetical protein
MKLVTHPGIINSVFFLQLVDNALADITEGSDIVGKYFKVDHDLVPLQLNGWQSNSGNSVSGHVSPPSNLLMLNNNTFSQREV